MRTKDAFLQSQTTLTNAVTFNSPDIPVGDINAAEVDVNLTSYAGLTNVTIQIWRKGLDGVYYNITPAAPTNVFTANGSYSVTLAAQNSASQGFGKTMRLSLVTTGAGSVSFTASIVGK